MEEIKEMETVEAVIEEVDKVDSGLELYKCTKTVEAKQMGRLEAEELGLVRDKTGTDEDGYFVKYSDEYSSWSPKEQFENGYRKMSNSVVPVA